MSTSTSRTYRVVVVAALAVAVVAVLGARRSPSTPEEAPEAGLPRLLELGSTDCTACKQMEPVLASLRKGYAGRLQVQFIDVYQDPKAAQEHGIQLIPTQIFFDAEGKEFFRHEGFFPEAEILATFRKQGIDLQAPAAKGGR
ncbi:MAG: thioredoxin family protein [Armatimonadetes bacterium]|jgi:thioredoxin 1|nr:thioredoxin family protein [Armatimonadota bacterium]